ncbi:ParA family protein [Sphaerimonospora cavernae]|uniref:ParA family protein n=1 Tax=Sphaerimonospora cavernae TaxID=1740611 RepID=A0ABV6U1T0_9ACTN
MSRPDGWVEDEAARAEALKRVIAVVNEKGGVGKTSITGNLAGQAASAGYRVLVVDLNRQANLAQDLGYRHKPEVDDEGAELLTAIMTGQPMTPMKDIRPNLDVIPGGTQLENLTGVMLTRIQNYGETAFLSLAKVLAPTAADYDLVIIDCPPENTILDDLALGAARWVLIPTKSDDGGVEGMRLVAQRFVKARKINPSIGLLGVVLFATGTTSTQIHAQVREKVAAAFGGQSPMFQTLIRHSERVAVDSRKGRLAHELEQAAKDQPQWWQALREGKRIERVSPTAASVSSDYQALAVEVLSVLATAEQEATV